MDRYDWRILEALDRDGRLSIRRLAERIGLSATPCLQRVRRLERDGLIRGYGARIDEVQAGYPLRVFVYVRLERQVKPLLDEFEGRVRHFEEITDCYLMAGEHDYVLRVVVPDLEAFNRFVNEKLSTIEGIASTQSSFVLREVFHRTFPLREPGSG